MICGYLAIWICCQTFCVVGVLRCCIFSGLCSSTILWIAVNSVYGRKQAKKFLLTPKRFERGKGFCLRKHYQLPQHTHAVPHKTCNHFWRSLWAYNPCNRKKTSLQISHNFSKTQLLNRFGSAPPASCCSWYKSLLMVRVLPLLPAHSCVSIPCQQSHFDLS